MILLITQLDNTLHASIVFQTTFCRAVPCPSKFPCSLDRMVLLSKEREDAMFLPCRYAKNPKETLVFANEEWKRGVGHVGVSLTQHPWMHDHKFTTIPHPHYHYSSTITHRH